MGSAASRGSFVTGCLGFGWLLIAGCGPSTPALPPNVTPPAQTSVAPNSTVPVTPAVNEAQPKQETPPPAIVPPANAPPTPEKTSQNSPPAKAGPEKIGSARLPNAYRLHPQVISGGLPEGDEAFRELKELGVQTVISVDGALPDVETAKKHGLRYVHLPHGYDGVPEERGHELAKAVRDLPGPVYIHCHHGKHRSPAAASIVCVELGFLDLAQAQNVLKVAGTSPNYKGLYSSVDHARKVEAKLLEELKAEFPERVAPAPLVESMTALEHPFDHLKQFQKNGWKLLPAHPALTPGHEALLLREHYTELLRNEVVMKGKPARFVELVMESEETALELEKLIHDAADKEIPAAEADAIFARVTGSCVTCHAEFRDNIVRDKQAARRLPNRF